VANRLEVLLPALMAAAGVAIALRDPFRSLQ